MEVCMNETYRSYAVNGDLHLWFGSMTHYCGDIISIFENLENCLPDGQDQEKSSSHWKKPWKSMVFPTEMIQTCWLFHGYVFLQCNAILKKMKQQTLVLPLTETVIWTSCVCVKVATMEWSQCDVSRIGHTVSLLWELFAVNSTLLYPIK